MWVAILNILHVDTPTGGRSFQYFAVICNVGRRLWLCGGGYCNWNFGLYLLVLPFCFLLSVWPTFYSENMSRSPCATSLKTILDIASDFKSPRLKLSPSVLHVNTNRTSLNRLSPYNNSIKCKSPRLSPGPPHFITAAARQSPAGNPSSFSTENKPDIFYSADSPHRLLFVSKIKTTVSTSNLLGRGRFGQVVLAKYKGTFFTLSQWWLNYKPNVCSDDYAAVKIVQKPSKQQFINEMNAQHLSHPNIVKVLKVEQIDDDVMIVMEPWGSLNLQQLLSLSVSIPFEEILR